MPHLDLRHLGPPRLPFGLVVVRWAIPPMEALGSACRWPLTPMCKAAEHPDKDCPALPHWQEGMGPGCLWRKDFAVNGPVQMEAQCERRTLCFC
mmetsp:Transcript_36794/g.106065  ORF Transcript_36794/g.106065 Transcript_36794/m.106065 type:complete len:94 (-) Transcript_36794:261-542(-)